MLKILYYLNIQKKYGEGVRLTIKINEFDYFIVEITNLENKMDYEILKKICSRYTLKTEIINQKINYKKRISIIEVKNSPKGIFLLLLIVNKFNPWFIIKGIKNLYKSDFPKELFQENYLPNNWNSKIEKILKNLVG